MDILNALMDKAVNDLVFPGGVLLVSHKREIVSEYTCGASRYDSDDRVSKHTVYDLASLTKPLATTVSFMVLLDNGVVTPETRIASILPEFDRSGHREITIAHLLVHCSGFPDYRPYYEALRNFDPGDRVLQLRAMLANEDLVNPVGARVVYSDPGFMVLAWLIDVLTGYPVDEFARDNIYTPLGIDDLYYIRHWKEMPDRCYAPTEQCGWRNKLICGEVHDDNAWICGGVDGHAGLFGTARGVMSLLDRITGVYYGVESETVFTRNTIRFFLSEYKKMRRTPGFDMPSAQGSASGSMFSKISVGHLGFTGTSFWVDLENEVVVVLLTNRVHPSRENLKIRDFRPVIHNAVMNGLGLST